jgi:two-component system NtrC family sensor kinase
MSQVRKPVGPRRLPLGNRLAFRLGLALVGCAGVVLLAVGAWNLQLQREHLTQLVGVSAEDTASTIRGATRDAMLRNEPEEVGRILQDIAAQESIHAVRIFAKEGRVINSTESEELGRTYDEQAEMCIICHERPVPLASVELERRQREFYDEEGDHVLGVIMPIANEPACSNAACHAHDSDGQLLGILDLQLSLDRVDALLAGSEKQLGLGLAVLAAAMLVASVTLTWSFVLRPVRRLTRATEKLAAGRYDSMLPVESRTELGLMAASWNTMVEELARARGELEDWSRTLEQRVADKTAQLETAVQQMIVVEKMASLGKLAAVVAHELNNPLTGIGTYARLLRRRVEQAAAQGGPLEAGENPSMNEALELIAAEAARCGEIVRNLLAFSRGSGARFTPQDLAPVLHRASLLVRHQAEMRGIRLRQEIADDLPPVERDAGQIEQLVLALAMNGVDAIGEKGELVLRAKPSPGGESVVLQVSDDGCGIPQEDLHRIFEPFFTRKGGQRSVGLGLAVVYGIVDRHHGAIQVESEIGQGTTFTVHLPLRQPKDKARPAPQPAEDAA